jgi:hypothetical protein
MKATNVEQRWAKDIQETIIHFLDSLEYYRYGSLDEKAISLVLSKAKEHSDLTSKENCYFWIKLHKECGGHIGLICECIYLGLYPNSTHNNHR